MYRKAADKRLIVESLDSNPVEVGDSEIFSWNFISLNSSLVFVKVYSDYTQGDSLIGLQPKMILAIPGSGSVYFEDNGIAQLSGDNLWVACVDSLDNTTADSPAGRVYVEIGYR